MQNRVEMVRNSSGMYAIVGASIGLFPVLVYRDSVHGENVSFRCGLSKLTNDLGGGSLRSHTTCLVFDDEFQCACRGL